MSAITKANVGDWQWLEETGGQLTSQQRLSMVPSLAVTFGEFFADRFRLQRAPQTQLHVDSVWWRRPQVHRNAFRADALLADLSRAIGKYQIEYAKEDYFPAKLQHFPFTRPLDNLPLRLAAR